ncbi:MAG: peroxiredoxin-like family protein [Microbacteriaceae bacterium]
MADGNQGQQIDLRAVVGRMIDRLRTEGLTPGIEVGEPAPRFVLPDARGEKVALDDRLADGPVVLSFYRGAWCPICNTELGGLQQALPQIEALGASLVAVSPQAPDASQAFVQRLGLGFDVLSDLDQRVIRSYRLQFELDPELRDVYGRMNMSLEEHNADGSWNLPVPATFVIDQDGMVRARHVDPNYRERMTVDAILSALEDLSDPA